MSSVVQLLTQAVVQPGIEGEVSGYTVGVWANIDIADPVSANDSAVSEIDLYIGKGLGSVAGWDVSAGLCQYTYPGSTSDGETELSISASGSLGGIDLSVGAYGDIDESSTPSYYEVSTGGSTVVAGLALDYGITAGYFETDNSATSGFGYAAYSVSYETGGGALSLTYVDEIDGDVVEVTESVVFAYGISL